MLPKKWAEKNKEQIKIALLILVCLKSATYRV